MKILFTLIFSILSFSSQAKILSTPTVGVLLDEIESSNVGVKKLMNPRQRHEACYHIGKINSFGQLLILQLQSIDSDESISKSVLKNANKVINKSKKMNKYCQNISTGLSFGSIMLNSRTNAVEKAIESIREKLTQQQLDSQLDNLANISLDRMLRKIENLPMDFDLELSESVPFEKFKPESCLNIGQYVPYYEVVGQYPKLERVEMQQLQNDNFKFLMEEIKELCFNERGYYKYFQDVSDLHKILGQR